jgi:hypothetical protein
VYLGGRVAGRRCIDDNSRRDKLDLAFDWDRVFSWPIYTMSVGSQRRILPIELVILERPT